MGFKKRLTKRPNTRGASAGFLNVDLELEGPRDLAPLVAALGDVVVLRHTVEEPFVAHVEIAGADLHLCATIDALLDLLDGLDGTGRRLWEECSKRRFSVGIRASLGPRCAEYVFPARIVQRLAAVGAEVSLAVYGAMSED